MEAGCETQLPKKNAPAKVSLKNAPAIRNVSPALRPRVVCSTSLQVKERIQSTSPVRPQLGPLEVEGYLGDSRRVFFFAPLRRAPPPWSPRAKCRWPLDVRVPSVPSARATWGTRAEKKTGAGSLKNYLESPSDAFKMVGHYPKLRGYDPFFEGSWKP